MNFGSVSQQTVGHPVRKLFLGTGEEATRTTLDLMSTIIRASSQNYYVRRWAEKIIQGINEADHLGKVEAIFNYIRGRSSYSRDPQGTELLKTPLVTLQLWEVGDYPLLDCDDYTILSLSLLKSIGFPVAIRASSYRPDGKFRHVYGMVKVGPNWMSLDLVKDYGPGWEAPGATKFMDLGVA